jgi:hypothetical protein
MPIAIERLAIFREGGKLLESLTVSKMSFPSSSAVFHQT